jgi:hypothetical protein
MQNNSNGFSLIELLLILLACGCIAVIGLYIHGKQTRKVAIMCTTTSSTSVDNRKAEDMYKTFITAIRQKDQECVDNLSSAYFIQYQKMVYPSANGNWVSYSQNGLPAMASRLALLPKTLDAKTFILTDYTESVVNGNDKGIGSSETKGTTITYPYVDNGTKMHLNLSFVTQNGKLLVDFFELKPALLDPRQPSETQSTSVSATSTQPANTTKTASPAPTNDMIKTTANPPTATTAPTPQLTQ